MWQFETGKRSRNWVFIKSWRRAATTHLSLLISGERWGIQISSKPEEPAVLFMLRTPCSPGAPRRDQYRAGRYELLNMRFETIERNIREQLQRI